MRPLVVVVLLLSCGTLSADTIKTQLGTSFEGIVTKFSSKQVDLDTGYGVLEFDRDEQFLEGTVSDYEWPKDSDTPSRDQNFVKYVESNAKGAIALVEIPRKLEEGETSAQKFTEAFTAADALRNDKRKSIKEKQDGIKKYEYTWTNLAALVESVEQAEGGWIRIKIAAGTWYDPRTGKPLALSHHARWVWSKEGLTTEEIKKNNSENQTSLWIEYEIALELKADSPLIFKEGFSGETGEIVWSIDITRYKPRKPIEKK